jgi:pimeloyl-ACP methyl ester carboxylesterase
MTLAAGRSVDVGGRSLFLRCSGSGAPTVILEAGAGGFSATWALVQPLVADFTRVCSYDRAGYGRSDPPPPAWGFTSEEAASDLHRMLRAAGAPPPYVLVGHSLGGYHVRVYAARFPDDVAGTVLVDADDEFEWSERYPPAHVRGLRLLTRLLGAAAALARIGIPQLYARITLPPVFQALPPDARDEVRRLFFRRVTLATMHHEMQALERSAAQVRALAGQLDDQPLAVLRRGKPGIAPPGTSAASIAAIEAAAAAGQEHLARLSSRSRLLTAHGSGHNPQVEEPAAVAQAIRDVVAAVGPAPRR